MGVSAAPFVLPKLLSSGPPPVKPVVQDAVNQFGPRRISIDFDVAIDAIPSQSPVGWTLKRLGSVIAVSSIQTDSPFSLTLPYAGTLTPDEVIWSGTGVAPTAVGGDPADPFDLVIPYP